METGQQGHETDTQIVRFVLRLGVLVLASLAVAIVGLIITYSADPILDLWGGQLLRFGVLGVFLLMDIMLGRLALWAWGQGKGLAGSMVFVVFAIATLSVVAALFLDRLGLAEILFYVAVLIGLPAPFVQAYHDRRHKTARDHLP